MLAKTVVEICEVLTNSVLGDVALELAGVVVVIVPSCHFFDQLRHLNVHDLIFLSDTKGVLLLLGAWRSHKDDSLGAARRIGILELENAVDLFNDTHLRRAAL